MRGSLEVARGSLEVVRGSLEVARGSLEVARGSLEVVRGSLEVVRGSLEVVRGSLEVVRGSLEGLCTATRFRSRAHDKARGRTRSVLKNRHPERLMSDGLARLYPGGLRSWPRSRTRSSS